MESSGKTINIIEGGLWKRIERWDLGKSASILWEKNWLKNGWCADCRYCCGPQGSDAPFPMALLPSQTGPDNERDFYMLAPGVAAIGAKGCKSDTDHGCRLPLEKKPVACGLFPLVLANGRLYLYQNCPASLAIPLYEFMAAAREAAKMLDQFSLKALRHLSIELTDKVLAEKYINMHVLLFDENGKRLELD